MRPSTPDLRRRVIPKAPGPPYEATFADFVQGQLVRVLPAEEQIRYVHRQLMDYVVRPDATFITRKVSGQERGEVVTTSDGTALLPSDNAPAWFFHSVMFNNAMPSEPAFADFVRETPTHFFDVAKYQTVNTAGWHVAHILDAKDGNTQWRTWSRGDAMKRFIRNVHPLNIFYVPKTDWQRVGGDPDLIGFVAWFYSNLFPDIWEEFSAVAGTPSLRPDAKSMVLCIGADARNQIRSLPGGAASPNRASWEFVLGARCPRSITAILAAHPEVELRTKKLQAGLTLERFVALGDALYNKTRKSMLEKQAPGDVVRQAEIAFDLIDQCMTKTYTTPSGWTGAIKLLRTTSAEGLDRTQALDIHGLATAALRVIDGPYSEAKKRGIR